MTKLEKLLQKQETIQLAIQKEKALELDCRLRRCFEQIVENELPASALFQRLLGRTGRPVRLDRFAQELESMIEGYISNI